MDKFTKADNLRRASTFVRVLIPVLCGIVSLVTIISANSLIAGIIIFLAGLLLSTIVAGMLNADATILEVEGSWGADTDEDDE